MSPTPSSSLVLLSCNSNPSLAGKISEYLNQPIAKADFRRFADGEIFVEIQQNVRGTDVFILQSTCPPVNDNLMELLVTVDALKRASARSITALVPYFGYARQDRKVLPRTPITAKLVADMLTAAGVDRVVTLDLHSGQIQGFFDIPFDNIFASPVLLDYLKQNYVRDEELQGDPENSNLVCVSPDAGGVERARFFAKRLNARVAMIDKRRTAPNEAKAMNLVGSVEGCRAIILDDMIDTAGTLTQAAEALIEHGATEVSALATHAVFSDPAIERIENSPLKEVVVTDSIPLRENAQTSSKIRVISVAGILAEAIRRINSHDSVSALFL